MTTELPKCDDDIFQNGTSLLVADTGDVGGCLRMEDWVIQIREASGEKVDWHYVGGRAVMRFLGDRDKVKQAVDKNPPPLTITILWWAPSKT